MQLTTSHNIPGTPIAKENRVPIWLLCTALVFALHFEIIAWLTRPVIENKIENPKPIEVTLLPVPEKPEPIQPKPVDPPKPKPIVPVKAKPVTSIIKAPLPPKPKAKATPKPAPAVRPQPVKNLVAPEPKPIAPKAIDPVAAVPKMPTPKSATISAPTSAPASAAKIPSTGVATGADKTDTNSSSEAQNQATVKPSAKYKPKPDYPESARRDHLEGKVLVKVRISTEGLPEQVTVAKTSGYDSLDDAAVEAVENWKFSPAMKGDVPFVATVTFPVTFKLED